MAAGYNSRMSSSSIIVRTTRLHSRNGRSTRGSLIISDFPRLVRRIPTPRIGIVSTRAIRRSSTASWVNYGKAIEAYLRKLVSRDASFDRYVAGDSNAISRDAKQGLKL